MRKFIVVMLSVMLLSGCSTKKVDEGIFEYQDSSVGDNSEVSNIIQQLKEDERIEGIELKTSENPYGIVVNYDGMEDEEAAVYYATYLFTLVTNVEWVSVHFNDAEITLTKNELQNWYDKELRTITSEEELDELIHSNADKWDEIVNSTK